MNELKLSLVIPAHNEEQTLPGVIAALQTELRSAEIPHEIVIVNDNSRDRTAEVVLAMRESDERICLLNRTPPSGFGRAVRAGLDQITGDVVVIYMADASDHPVDV